MEGEGVLIITRLSTQNAGNEALSKELIHLICTNTRKWPVRVLDRHPRYFEKFTLKGLGKDPIAGFEAVLDFLFAKFQHVDAPSAPTGVEGCVRLDGRGWELTGPLRNFKRKVGLRRRLASAGLLERKKVAVAVRACMNASTVIWNPAGEIRPALTSENEVVRLLLLVGIAQRSARQTAVINHSLEVENPRLRELITYVYSKANYVGLRDGRSITTARLFGIPDRKLVEAPDLVFLAQSRPGREAPTGNPRGAIALAVNGLEAMAGADEWRELIAGLNTLGRPLLFVSNAMNHDLAFARRLAAWSLEPHVVTYQPGYQELRGYYRHCSALVSSRLHASVLALTEGVPVVSIEPSVFKLTAVFQQMNYPLPTERLQSVGWSDRVLANVRRCLSAEREELKAEGARIMTRQIAHVQASYAPLLRLACGMPSTAPIPSLRQAIT